MQLIAMGAMVLLVTAQQQVMMQRVTARLVISLGDTAQSVVAQLKSI